MIRDLMSGNFDMTQFIMRMLYFIPVVLITLTVHEYAHGYVAYKLGDPTAKMMGRLTPNPVKHLDPVGFLMMVFVGFGWAKPVMINARNFKNPKKGMAISASAGPASNLIMAVIGVLIYEILFRIFVNAEIFNSFAASALTFFGYFTMLNVWFAVFNLLPVPPLDGSRIVTYFLPPKLGYYYSYVERYGIIVLMILIIKIPYIPFTGILRPLLNIMTGLILNGIDSLVSLLFIPFGG